MPDTVPPVSRLHRNSFRSLVTNHGLISLSCFRHEKRWVTLVPLPGSHLTTMIAHMNCVALDGKTRLAVRTSRSCSSVPFQFLPTQIEDNKPSPIGEGLDQSSVTASRRHKLRDHLSGLPPRKSCGHGNPVTGKNLFLFVAGEFVSPAGRAFNQPPRVGAMDDHKTVRGCNRRGQTCGATQQ